MRFTDRSIAALKPKAKFYEVWGDGRTGPGVRVSPKGRKSWNYRYRFDGKARRLMLGTYPALGLANARVKHANAKELLAKGTDPGALHVEKRRAERQAETVRLSEKPAIGLTGIVPHDPRRTAASNMAALGINRLVISKILNHVETNLTAIYDRHAYDVEKRHALEAWATHLEGILSGKPKADTRGVAGDGRRSAVIAPWRG